MTSQHIKQINEDGTEDEIKTEDFNQLTKYKLYHPAISVSKISALSPE